MSVRVLLSATLYPGDCRKLTNHLKTVLRPAEPAADAARPVRTSLSRISFRVTRSLLTRNMPYRILTRTPAPSSVNRDVIVRLKWGETEYKGRLVSIDSYLNIQLSGAEEYIGDKLTSALGEVLIRYVYVSELLLLSCGAR